MEARKKKGKSNLEECGVKEAFFLWKRLQVCLYAYRKDPVDRGDMKIWKSGEKF